ncbi:hypothetical protein PZN02_006231 (plasmid) [Sinorhizobium garamanticum]|uniref:Uncharacterized protein n=1 Tax=Sinorhizobium garamanticum TaxID=680247 RepID=A0ABY8DMA0_9HYPH|nr:hypothetical protein [Sinorhizobium garamanticum]WEX91447.1 hypothetical protein PZN02_006231 [Sinorhizobium garamanticum]
MNNLAGQAVDTTRHAGEANHRLPAAKSVTVKLPPHVDAKISRHGWA